MATAKKINQNAQAPELMKRIKAELSWTQEDLCRYLGITQQAVSNYSLGYVEREQYEVIKKLESIVAKKLPPPSPNAEEVIIDGIRDSKAARGNDAGGAVQTKKASVSPISKGQTKGGSTTKRKRS